MPTKIVKRGKKRLIGTVEVRGHRQEKLFPDQSKISFAAASYWETRKRQELLTKTGEEVTIRDWINDYLAFAKARYKGKHTYAVKKKALTRFSAFIGPGQPIKKIQLGQCQRYFREQASKRTGNASNRDRKELGTAWEYGRQYYGFPRVNPFRLVDKFPEDKFSKYVPPMADFIKVLGCTEGQDWTMLMVFICLAPRKSEVFRMKRRDIDFDNKRIQLWTRKRKGGNLESDWLPGVDLLMEALQVWIKQRKKIQSHDRAHIFISTRTRQRFKTRDGFIQGLCRKARVRRFNFHSIRHLTAMFLYYSGESAQTIQMILRHKNPQTTAKYLKRIGVEEGRNGLAKISEQLNPIAVRVLGNFKDK